MSKLFAFITLWTVCLSSSYPGPLREWQTGFWEGNPIYSPLGRFDNYSMVFRQNDDKSFPSNTLLVETGIDFESAQGSYQQWTIVDNGITYCGLLTMDGGKTYLTTRPTFYYQPQISSEYEVYFCADRRGGGCDTFKWEWIYYNDTNQFRSVNTVSNLPHQDTLFSLTNINSNNVPIQTQHRNMCKYILGNQEPFDYDWLNNGSNSNSYQPKMKIFTHKNRKAFIDSIPNYQKHYDTRKHYKKN